tara:strand:+ start:139 stop:927 length:789 start_codon:yes stop_codon:yes gene_type:complete
MPLTNIQLEELELQYFETIISSLRSNIRGVVDDLQSMNKIKEYWKNIAKSGDGYDAGFERVIYSSLQRGTSDLGRPNSCLVGADLFFESTDAFIHIDLKSNQPGNNTSDHWSPKMEANQSSYRINYEVDGEERKFEANLPKYYIVNNIEKPTLTYFISILYVVETNDNIFNNLSIANINISCMPNGQLVDLYNRDPVGAGGNIDIKKARFRMWSQNKILKFRALENQPNRLRLLFENQNLVNETEMTSKKPFLKLLSSLRSS